MVFKKFKGFQLSDISSIRRNSTINGDIVTNNDDDGDETESNDVITDNLGNIGR